MLPGFGPALGFTLAYLSLIVLIPLAALVLRPAELGFAGFIAAVSEPRVVAALKLSFGASLIAASINAVFGLIVAWVLVRYRFPGKRLVDALVDLPFALPTAVAGRRAHRALRAERLDRQPACSRSGVQVAFTPLGIVVALVFIGLPFVVRTVQPVLQDIEREVEEAAASLGASRLQTIVRVILPAILPALLTGYALALARAVGEYGSVIFIAGNMPMVSEIAPLLIVIKLEQYDYAGAAAVGVAMLIIAFVMLLVLNLLQRWNHAPLTPPVAAGRPRALPARVAPIRRIEEPLWVRLLLIGTGLGFIVAVPGVAAGLGVRRGLPPGGRRLLRRASQRATRWRAIRLTLLVAAIAVPLQPGVRGGRRLGHRQVRVSRQEPADHASIDLPFSVSPVVAGPHLRAAVRRRTAGSGRG